MLLILKLNQGLKELSPLSLKYIDPSKITPQNRWSMTKKITFCKKLLNNFKGSEKLAKRSAAK